MSANPIRKLSIYIKVDYVVILLIALVGHGLLLLNDGIYWDDWLYYDALLHKQSALLQTTFNQIGYPLTGYIHQFLGLFPNFVIVYKIAIFLLLLSTAILIHIILEKSKLVSRIDNLLIVSITLLYPAFRARGLLTLAPRELWIFLFFLGFLLSICAEESSSKRRILYRAAALGCFYLSFTENILLPNYFGFLLLFVYIYSTWRPEARTPSVKAFLLRHVDFLILPFLFWLIKRAFFAPYGDYQGYGSFALFSVGYYFPAYVVYGAILPWGYGVQLVKDQIIGWLMLLPIIYWVVFHFRNKIAWSPAKRIPRFAAKSLLIFGIIWLGLAITPFAVVGLPIDDGFFTTRSLILVPFPMALIIVSITRLLSNISQQFTRLLYVALFWIIIVFGGVTIRDYISLEARWVKDRSIMENLSKDEQARSISIFEVTDNVPSELHEPYRLYEWAFMFKSIWGDERRVAIDHTIDVGKFLDENKPYFDARYGLADLDPAGCRGSLIINQGQPQGEFNLVAGYLYDRFFQPDHLDNFLSQVTQIKVIPLNSPNGTC